MNKSFTINTPEYQNAQKKFYAYNVANDKSTLNTSNIKSITFNFHLTNENMTLASEDDDNDDMPRYMYTLDDENTATLHSLQDFYINNYDKIIDMSAKGNYIVNVSSSITALANNIFSKDVNAYTITLSDDNDNYNFFILSADVAAKTLPILLSSTVETNITLADSFAFVIADVSSSEALEAGFMSYGIPYFADFGDSSKSDISVIIYYIGDDE